MEPRHEKIAKVALEAGGSQGLALAGGYAVTAHGMGHRPSGDVDLFTDWRDRENFPGVVAAVVGALETHGFKVEVGVQGDTFARLLVSDDDPDSSPGKVELAADWRAHPPVFMEIGPVLHPDDAVANKMGALFGRAVARDFLDDAAPICAVAGAAGRAGVGRRPTEASRSGTRQAGQTRPPDQA